MRGWALGGGRIEKRKEGEGQSRTRRHNGKGKGTAREKQGQRQKTARASGAGSRGGALLKYAPPAGRGAVWRRRRRRRARLWCTGGGGPAAAQLPWARCAALCCAVHCGQGARGCCGGPCCACWCQQAARAGAVWRRACRAVRARLFSAWLFRALCWCVVVSLRPLRRRAALLAAAFWAVALAAELRGAVLG